MQCMASGKRQTDETTHTPQSFDNGAHAQNVAPGSYHPEHIQGNPRLSQCWDFDAMPLGFNKVTITLKSSPETGQRFFTNTGPPIH